MRRDVLVEGGMCLVAMFGCHHGGGVGAAAVAIVMCVVLWCRGERIDDISKVGFQNLAVWPVENSL